MPFSKPVNQIRRRFGVEYFKRTENRGSKQSEAMRLRRLTRRLSPRSPQPILTRKCHKSHLPPMPDKQATNGKFPVYRAKKKRKFALYLSIGYNRRFIINHLTSAPRMSVDAEMQGKQRGNVSNITPYRKTSTRRPIPALTLLRLCFYCYRPYNPAVQYIYSKPTGPQVVGSNHIVCGFSSNVQGGEHHV